MPRSARFIVPNYPYHITHRGNNKQTVFFTDDDRRRYLHWFQDASQKYGMKILSYCLMNNHVHFVACADNNLTFAKTVNSVHMRYAQYFNKEYNKVGHLWQGRYYSCLLDQAHLLAALRYVERNPVRADLVKKPWNWAWSSVQEHLNLNKGILTIENISKYVSIHDWRLYLDVQEPEEDLLEIRKQTLLRRAWAKDDFKVLIQEKYGVQLMLKPKGRSKVLV